MRKSSSLTAVAILLAGASADAQNAASVTGRDPSATGPAAAQDSSDDQPVQAVDQDTLRARELFRKGAKSVARAEWLEAFDAFRQSAELRPHPVTTFNMGVCLRATSQYTAARKVFSEALRQNAEAGGQLLSETLRTQCRAFIGEIDQLLVKVEVHLLPSNASIAIDGRPLDRLEALAAGNAGSVAGVRPPGKGEHAPAERFDVFMDPGAHVFMVSLRGFQDIVVNRTYPPGSTQKLDLELARLPASISIDADVAGVVVTVNDIDVGMTPLKIQRPAGSYRIVMRRPEYVSYETRVSVKPGESANITGRLSPVEPSIYSKWWFWGIAGAVVAGAAATTYALTRPEPQRPAPDGGTLGWVVDAR